MAVYVHVHVCQCVWRALNVPQQNKLAPPEEGARTNNSGQLK